MRRLPGVASAGSFAALRAPRHVRGVRRRSALARWRLVPDLPCAYRRGCAARVIVTNRRAPYCYDCGRLLPKEALERLPRRAFFWFSFVLSSRRLLAGCETPRHTRTGTRKMHSSNDSCPSNLRIWCLANALQEMLAEYLTVFMSSTWERNLLVEPLSVSMPMELQPAESSHIRIPVGQHNMSTSY